MAYVYYLLFPVVGAFLGVALAAAGCRIAELVRRPLQAENERLRGEVARLHLEINDVHRKWRIRFIQDQKNQGGQSQSDGEGQLLATLEKLRRAGRIGRA